MAGRGRDGVEGSGLRYIIDVVGEMSTMSTTVSSCVEILPLGIHQGKHACNHRRPRRSAFIFIFISPSTSTSTSNIDHGKIQKKWLVAINNDGMLEETSAVYSRMNVVMW